VKGAKEMMVLDPRYRLAREHLFRQENVSLISVVLRGRYCACRFKSVSPAPKGSPKPRLSSSMFALQNPKPAPVSTLNLSDSHHCNVGPATPETCR
jgi:hypothetical protein